MTKKLTILVSQDCETKHGQYSVSARELSVEFTNEDSVGIVLGDLVEQFFDVLNVQRKYKRSPYKLNKPIQLKVMFEDTNFSAGAHLKDTFEQGVLISGGTGVKRFAAFLVDLLYAAVKSKRSPQQRQNVTVMLDGNYVANCPRTLCDSTMETLLSVAGVMVN